MSKKKKKSATKQENSDYLAYLYSKKYIEKLLDTLDAKEKAKNKGKKIHIIIFAVLLGLFCVFIDFLRYDFSIAWISNFNIWLNSVIISFTSFIFTYNIWHICKTKLNLDKYYVFNELWPLLVFLIATFLSNTVTVELTIFNYRFFVWSMVVVGIFSIFVMFRLIEIGKEKARLDQLTITEHLKIISDYEKKHEKELK